MLVAFGLGLFEIHVSDGNVVSNEPQFPSAALVLLINPSRRSHSVSAFSRKIFPARFPNPIVLNMSASSREWPVNCQSRMTFRIGHFLVHTGV